MVISFSSEKPRRQLLEKGRVFTARVHRRKQFIDQPWGRGINDWANEGRTKPKIVDVVIFEVGRVQANELHYWQFMSGFEDMDEWVEEIKRLNKWKDVRTTDKFWLYMVCERGHLFKPWSERGESIECC